MGKYLTIGSYREEGLFGLTVSGRCHLSWWELHGGRCVRQLLTLHTVNKQSEWDGQSNLKAHFSDPQPTARLYLLKADSLPTQHLQGSQVFTDISFEDSSHTLACGAKYSHTLALESIHIQTTQSSLSFFWYAW